MEILIRAGKRPETVLSPEASLARNRSGVFGANVGNFLFSHAVFELLSTPSASLTPDSMSLEQTGITKSHIAAINERFDVFVLPLANAFRPSFLPWLDRLTSVISELTIPVSVVGVGAQLPFSGKSAQSNPRLDASVRAFCNAVLERAPSIGVRGDITAQYLLSLGYSEDQIDVIGCPSLYVNGPAHRVVRPDRALTSESKIAFNVTPSVNGMGEFLERSFAQFPDSVFVPQEFRELQLLLWGDPIPGYPADLPGTIDHWMYRDGKIRFFVDTLPWFEFMKTRDFSVGNRIHGTIAALSAGTPAMLLSHDSRTRELAEFHSIPFVQAKGALEDADVGALYEQSMFEAFNTQQGKNFGVFSKFLQRHGLRHVFEEGQSNAEYSELLSHTPYPEGVAPLHAGNTAQIAARLQWLRQGIPGDQERAEGAYKLPFAPSSHQVESPRQAIASLTSSTDSLEKKIHGSQGQLSKLNAELSRVKAQLELHDEHFSYMRRPAGERLARAVKTRVRRLFRFRDS